MWENNVPLQGFEPCLVLRLTTQDMHLIPIDVHRQRRIGFACLETHGKMATHKDGPTRGLRLPCGNVKHHFVIHQTEQVRLKGIGPSPCTPASRKTASSSRIGRYKTKVFSAKKSKRIYRITLCAKRRLSSFPRRLRYGSPPWTPSIRRKCTCAPSRRSLPVQDDIQESSSPCSPSRQA